MVREILSEKDTPANEELVLAMIYTETKGKEGDVMQSSESASGSTNTINDNASSIRQGVQTLTDNLYLAQKKGVDVWTAVQAYNFWTCLYRFYRPKWQGKYLGSSQTVLS